MIADWNSDSTEILLNPRIPQQEQELFRRSLRFAGLDAHIWVATSGTTGKLKFVALCKKAILCSADAVNKHLEATSGDIWLNPLPNFHVGGIGIYARAYCAGAKVIDLTTKWDPKAFVNALTETQATLSAMVPTQLYDCVQLKLKPPISLRSTVIGGGVLPESLYESATKLGWLLLPSYGLTECASQVATAEPGAPDKLKILDHVTLKIDHEGFIHIKSHALLTAYGFIENCKLAIEDPKVDGWVKTEDKGTVDGNYLKVLGRGSDFLKVGGESVNLFVLQKTLDRVKAQLNMTQDTVLFPLSDERLGQVVALSVEGKASPETEHLIKSYQEEVLPFEQIKHVQYVESIPRNDMGKVKCPTGILTQRRKDSKSAKKKFNIF